MAGLDTAFLNNVTRDHFIKTIKNQMYNQSPFFNRLFAKGRVQTMTGVSLNWAVIMKKHTAVGRYVGYDTFANQPINPTVIASLVPCDYYAALAISGDEERRNSGAIEKLLDILRIQFDNGMSTMKGEMYTDAYSDGSLVGGRYGLYGLQAAVSASNIYANINRATAGNESWRSNVDATPHTVANMKDPTSVHYMPSLMRTNYTIATHDHSPNIIISTKALYNLYQDIAGVQNLRFDNDVANLGFGGVQFGPGVTLVFDDFCTTAYMYFLALQDWNVFVYSDANFSLRGKGWREAQNQDAKIAQIIWSGQMRLDSPWHQAVSTAMA